MITLRFERGNRIQGQWIRYIELPSGRDPVRLHSIYLHADSFPAMPKHLDVTITPAAATAAAEKR